MRSCFAELFFVALFLPFAGGRGDMSVNPREIGQRIRKLRVDHGLTQPQLAKAVNVTTNYISHIESGRRMGSIDFLVETADFFSVTLDNLILGKL